MQLLQKHIFFATALSSVFLFTACAPESKYNGGSGALGSYESMDAYGNSTIKYRQDYTQPTQSSFSSALVANDRDNIKQTPQNNRIGQESVIRESVISRQTQNGQTQGSKTTQNTKQSQYEAPVQGNGGFTPTQSLLGGMRDSEAIQRATMRPYTVRGKTYRPHPVKVGDTFDGVASWYGPDFHAKATSNGETYNMHAHTAANKTLPMNTIVRVYNKDNGKTTVVRINDRGPFVEGRIIDLSNVAAHDIAMVSKGIANVRIEVIGFGGDLANNKPTKDSNTQATQEQVTQRIRNTESRTQPQIEQQPPLQQNEILKPTQEAQTTYTESPQITKSATQEQVTQRIRNTESRTQPQIEQQPPLQQNEILKPTQEAQTTYTESPQITKSATQEQVTHTETANANQSKIYDGALNTDKAITPNTSTSNLKTESIDTSENQTSDKENDFKEYNKEIETNSFAIDEEELPEFDDKKQEIKSKPQPTKNETIDSNFTSVTPKHIDNTESIRNIDEAVKKLKDSTENLTKKTQDEPKEQAKENSQYKNNPTNPQIEEKTEFKNSNNIDSKIEVNDIKGSFIISLNVFSDEDRAKSFKHENKDITKDTNYSIDIIATDKGYRVALRGFKTYDEAKSFIEEHNIKGYIAKEE